MLSPERRSTTETITGFSKKLDIGGMIVGLIIDGQFGKWEFKVLEDPKELHELLKSK